MCERESAHASNQFFSILSHCCSCDHRTLSNAGELYGALTWKWKDRKWNGKKGGRKRWWKRRNECWEKGGREWTKTKQNKQTHIYIHFDFEDNAIKLISMWIHEYITNDVIHIQLGCLLLETDWHALLGDSFLCSKNFWSLHIFQSAKCSVNWTVLNLLMWHIFGPLFGSL